MWLNNHLILKFRMTILENQAEYKILQVLGVISRETLLFHWKSKLTHKIRRNKLLRKTCSCGRTIRSRKQRLLFSSCVMDSTPFTIKEIKLPFAFKPDPDRHEISLSLSKPAFLSCGCVLEQKYETRKESRLIHRDKNYLIQSSSPVPWTPLTACATNWTWTPH